MSETATSRATEALRALILEGALPPGSDHLEAELAERLQMSRTPVREALTRLEAQGLVELRPRRGARIVGLSSEDMNDIYEVLTALEATAAARAATRRARMATLALRPLPQRSNDDHKAVSDAISAGDADRARMLHHAHREQARLLLTELLRKHQLTWL